MATIAGAPGGLTASAGTRSVTAGLSDIGLPRGVSPWWLALFLLGSAIMAGGLRRLPDRVLETDEAAHCSLEAGS